MVDGFTKDGTFRPVNKSPFPSSALNRQAVQTQTQEVEKKESDRNKAFAIGRAENFRKGGRATAKGLRTVGRGLQFGKEKIQQSRIEKSIRDREFSERIDADIDRIIDEPNSSDARKFRLLVRFARLNRKNLTKDQAKFIDRTNRELAQRIKEDRKSGLSSGSGGGAGSGITQEELNKLPQQVRNDVEKAVS